MQKRGIIQRNDILIVKDGATTGKVSFVDKNFSFSKSMVNEHVFILRPTKDVLPKWLFYYIYSSHGQSQIKKSFHGMVGGINTRFAEDFHLLLPPNETQKKIVEILDKANELRERKKRSFNLINQLIQSIFVKMFGDPTSNPLKWPFVPLSDLIIRTQYGTSSLLDESDGISCLRMNNLTEDGVLDVSDLKYFNSSDEVQKYHLNKGDILFNRTNSRELVGKTALFDLDSDYVFAGYLIRIVVNNEKCNPYYLNTYMNLPDTKRKIRSMAKGAVGQANINAQEIQKLHIMIPFITLQKKFQHIVEITREKLRKEQTLMKEYDKLLQSILTKSFSGKLVF